MKIGDKVWWFSQANSTLKRKQGEIVRVIPAFTALTESEGRELAQQYAVNHTLYGMLGVTRKVESYFVAVPSPSGKGKPRLYWPRVQYLNPVVELAPTLKPEEKVPHLRHLSSDEVRYPAC